MDLRPLFVCLLLAACNRSDVPAPPSTPPKPVSTPAQVSWLPSRIDEGVSATAVSNPAAPLRSGVLRGI